MGAASVSVPPPRPDGEPPVLGPFGRWQCCTIVVSAAGCRQIQRPGDPPERDFRSEVDKDEQVVLVSPKAPKSILKPKWPSQTSEGEASQKGAASPKEAPDVGAYVIGAWASGGKGEAGAAQDEHCGSRMMMSSEDSTVKRVSFREMANMPSKNSRFPSKTKPSPSPSPTDDDVVCAVQYPSTDTVESSGGAAVDSTTAYGMLTNSLKSANTPSRSKPPEIDVDNDVQTGPASASHSKSPAGTPTKIILAFSHNLSNARQKLGKGKGEKAKNKSKDKASNSDLEQKEELAREAKQKVKKKAGKKQKADQGASAGADAGAPAEELLILEPLEVDDQGLRDRRGLDELGCATSASESSTFPSDRGGQSCCWSFRKR
mmetsp:Transcript_70598/g.199226  ORF Transcript_70598/g.199226 Transcript_70598/m.199226 type:complete len:374 (-) Transcript_70598:89-1210(-)